MTRVANDSAIRLWSQSEFGAPFSLVASSNGLAIASGDGTYFESFGDLRYTPDGTLYFGATLSDNLIGSSPHGTSLWKSNPGESPELIVRGGDDVPGLDGHQFLSLRVASISSNNKVAFLGATVNEGQTTQGAWVRDEEGVLRRFLARGDWVEALGADGPVSGRVTYIGNLNINSRGDLALNVVLDGHGWAALFLPGSAVQVPELSSGVLLASAIAILVIASKLSKGNKGYATAGPSA